MNNNQKESIKNAIHKSRKLSSNRDEKGRISIYASEDNCFAVEEYLQLNNYYLKRYIELTKKEFFYLMQGLFSHAHGEESIAKLWRATLDGIHSELIQQHIKSGQIPILAEIDKLENIISLSEQLLYKLDHECDSDSPFLYPLADMQETSTNINLRLNELLQHAVSEKSKYDRSQIVDYDEKGNAVYIETSTSKMFPEPVDDIPF